MLNISEADVAYSDVYRSAMEEGFRAGAGHVEFIVGVMALSYLVQAVVYLAVSSGYSFSFLFSSSEGMEYYRRFSSRLQAARFAMVLILLFKTSFVFVGGGV